MCWPLLLYPLYLRWSLRWSDFPKSSGSGARIPTRGVQPQSPPSFQLHLPGKLVPPVGLEVNSVLHGISTWTAMYPECLLSLPLLLYYFKRRGGGGQDTQPQASWGCCLNTKLRSMRLALEKEKKKSYGRLREGDLQFLHSCAILKILSQLFYNKILFYLFFFFFL